VAPSDGQCMHETKLFFLLPIDVAPQGVTTFEVQDLKVASKYSISILAFNSIGASSYTDPILVTTNSKYKYFWIILNYKWYNLYSDIPKNLYLFLEMIMNSNNFNPSPLESILGLLTSHYFLIKNYVFLGIWKDCLLSGLKNQFDWCHMF